jgi:hypothetical protein
MKQEQPLVVAQLLYEKLLQNVEVKFLDLSTSVTSSSNPTNMSRWRSARC